MLSLSEMSIGHDFLFCLKIATWIRFGAQNKMKMTAFHLPKKTSIEHLNLRYF